MLKKIHHSIRLDVLGLFLAGVNNTFLALAVAVFIHGPGTTSSQPDLMLRALYIAENTTLWKAGWLFWFAPTLSFSWSYFALGRHLDNSRPWRDLAIGIAVVAAAVDIVGVLVNLYVLPELAGILAADYSATDLALQGVFRSFELLANNLTNLGGYGLYSLAGILILPAAFRTVGFPRWLAWLGTFEWGISILATILLILSPQLSTIPFLISFLLYAPWVWGSAVWIVRKTSPQS